MKIIKKFITFLIITGIIAIIGCIIVFAYYKRQISIQIPNPTVTSFTISPSESIQDVSSSLQRDHIITNTLIFSLYLKFNHLDTKIQVGTYVIPKSSSIISIAHLLQNSVSDTIFVTIPEGLRLEEQAAIIEGKLKGNSERFSAAAFIALAKPPSSISLLAQFSYPFITSTTTSLEGFLYPDTYSFEKDADANMVIHSMLDTFQKKVYAGFANTPFDGYSLYQHIIIASLLEREATTNTDRQMITDILERRLAQNFPLGIDSTIQYALGYSATEHSWWRQNLYEADLIIDSPYNTRIQGGLPPTPIANPGFASIRDSYNPIRNNYFYYISDNAGILHYAITNAQQNANIATYLR